jgi:hypothetical protein
LRIGKQLGGFRIKHKRLVNTGQCKGFPKLKLSSQMFQHGLTSLLGLGERLEG